MWGAATRKTLYVPGDYVSDDPIASESVWTGSDFSTFGVTSGESYVWTWDSGGSADSITLNIGDSPAAVPEPSSLALLGVMGSIGFVGRRLRRRRRKTTES